MVAACKYKGGKTRRLKGSRAKPKTHLGELALLINEGDDVHGLDGNHVQGILVISELNVLPVDVLQVVLLLLQLEDMAHKELLQVFICKVNAKLLKTVKGRSRKGHFRSTMVYPSPSLFMLEAILSVHINHSVRLLLAENVLIRLDNLFFFPKPMLQPLYQPVEEICCLLQHKSD